MTHLILNPVAGSGKTVKLLPQIKHELELRKIEFVIWETKKPMDAKRLAAKACAEGTELIICVGGDGTLHEVISGMVYSNVSLGIIPAGSGNDFIASIGISHKASLHEHLNRIFSDKIKPIDVIKSGEFYFVNVGSIGMDAEIANKAVGLKRVFKRYAYLVSTVITVFKFKNFDANIMVDDKKISGKCTLIAAANGKYYGGGFKIAPSASANDGLITLCVVKNFNMLLKLLLFPLVIIGLHTKLKGIEFYTCKKVVVSYENTVNVNYDGNLYELKAPITFEVLPKAINVIC